LAAGILRGVIISLFNKQNWGWFWIWQSVILVPTFLLEKSCADLSASKSMEIPFFLLADVSDVFEKSTQEIVLEITILMGCFIFWVDERQCHKSWKDYGKDSTYLLL